MVESSGTIRDADLRGAGLRQYGRVDPVAILSLALGLFGCLTVRVGGWFSIPVPVAVGVAILSLKRIRSSKGALVGTPLAVGGIVLWVLLVGARWGYDWSTADKRSRGIERSTAVVNEFFDWIVRGYPEDAYALLSVDGKEQYKDQLKQLKPSLEPMGRYRGVTFDAVRWERDSVGEMGFSIRFDRGALRCVVMMVSEEGDWRIRQLQFKDAPPPPASAEGAGMPGAD